jgi:hypothetical protein
MTAYTLKLNRRLMSGDMATAAGCTAAGCVFAWLAVVGTALAAWCTHVIVCIKTSAWFLLAFGTIVPPIGWLHGFAVWFGWL